MSYELNRQRKRPGANAVGSASGVSDPAARLILQQFDAALTGLDQRVAGLEGAVVGEETEQPITQFNDITKGKIDAGALVLAGRRVSHRLGQPLRVSSERTLVKVALPAAGGTSVTINASDGESGQNIYLGHPVT